MKVSAHFYYFRSGEKTVNIHFNLFSLAQRKAVFKRNRKSKFESEKKNLKMIT